MFFILLLHFFLHFSLYCDPRSHRMNEISVFTKCRRLPLETHRLGRFCVTECYILIKNVRITSPSQQFFAINSAISCKKKI